MSKLKELIAELCPNGVEYKTLGEVATITRGGNFQKKDFKEQGYPCIHYGQIYTKYGLFVEKTITYLTEDCAEKQKKASKNDVIMAVTSENIEDVCKCVAWLGDTDVAVSGHTAIIHHTLNAKYLVYYLHTNDFFKQKRKLAHGTKVIEVTPDTLKSVRLPVPPLPVQEEIVRILDSFTSLTAELQAELQARQKQYEYYRDRLLTFDVHEGGTSEVQWKTIGEICRIYAGGDAPKSRMSKEKSEQYTVPIISNGVGKNAIYGYTDEAKVTETAVTVAARGTIGYAEYRDYPYYPIIRLITLIPIATDELNPKYLYYCLQGRQYSVPITGIPQLTAPMIRQVEIPIPKLEIQKKIVHVLDNFDAICFDLNIGLPAEIEARQKQYEYYRDRLLSFPKLT